MWSLGLADGCIGEGKNKPQIKNNLLFFFLYILTDLKQDLFFETQDIWNRLSAFISKQEAF